MWPMGLLLITGIILLMMMSVVSCSTWEYCPHVLMETISCDGLYKLGFNCSALTSFEQGGIFNYHMYCINQTEDCKKFLRTYSLWERKYLNHANLLQYRVSWDKQMIFNKRIFSDLILVILALKKERSLESLHYNI